MTPTHPTQASLGEVRHTPGPWRVNYTKFSQVLAPNGALIATCAKLGSLTELQDNARAIALTPDLISIARRLASLSEGLSNGNSAAEHAVCELADFTRSLLARATSLPNEANHD